MLNLSSLLSRKYEIEELLEGFDDLKKELAYIDGLLKLYKNSEDGYETRSMEDSLVEYNGNLQGVKSAKAIKHSGKVFRYNLSGELIAVYKNSKEAQNALAEEEYKTKGIPVEKSTIKHNQIEYACTGTYNPNGKKNPHIYKDSVYFTEKLTEEKMEECKEKGIFI